MTTPSLQQTGAPTQPADIVENPNLSNYYNALDAVYEILKLEHDPEKRMKVEESRAFFESVIRTIEEPDTTAQPPAPPPPVPPLAAMGQPGIGGPPGQPPGGPLPGMQGGNPPPPQVSAPASAPGGP